ncbi:MAG: hypothetical protein ABF301_07550, partial [Sulfurovum sp.]
VVENFKLVTYDVVKSPSDFNATMNGLVESYQLNEGIIEDLTFGLDSNGNIVKMNESDCQSECHLFEKEDIENAFKEKFSFLLSEMKSKEIKLKEAFRPESWEDCIASLKTIQKSLDSGRLKSVIDDIIDFINKNK